MKIYKLYPVYEGRRSYYGKAVVRESNGTKTLYSYDTPVCQITPEGEIVRLWPGYSRTTMRHINEFLNQNGFLHDCTVGGVAWWREQPARRWTMDLVTDREDGFYLYPRAL